MTTRPETYTKGRSSSITEYGPNEINRTTREKGIKTLQDIRKDNLKANNLAADNVKDFLQDTNNSFSSEDGRLPNDAYRLEKRINKQQYLVNNKLFDPTEYFGGLDISNLEEHPADQRLEDMFMYYLPTEAEEKEVTAQPIVKQTQSDKTQTKSSNPPKQLDLSKSTWSTKDKGNFKADVFKSPTKEFPETAKAGKEVVDFEPLSPLSASHSKMHSNFKKEFGQNLFNKTKNPVKAKTACQTVTSVVQEYKPVVIAHKKKKSTGLSDKENKVDERETNLRAKKSASVSKKPGSSDNSKQNYRTISDVNSNSFVPKSVNTSLSRNNRSTVQDGHHNYSLNTTAKINLSQHASQKAEIDRKLAISEKTSPKEDPSQRLGSTKMDTQSTGRSKTKSSDQTQTAQNMRRNRKGRKNFSSFNNTLTTEDEQPEFLFKSFNTLSRPQTSHTVSIDDNNYVLKGILSPTVTKSLVSKGINTSKAPKNNQKAGDKPQPVNPLKFLNDLLNKRKISAGSSDHLRMPKKPTFLENKTGSPVAQIGPKHAKTPSKSDLFEARITSQVNKKAQGVSASNYASANSFKNLFTLKGFEK